MIKYLNQPKGTQKKMLYVPYKAIEMDPYLGWNCLEVYMEEQGLYKNLVLEVELISDDTYQQLQLNGNFSFS